VQDGTVSNSIHLHHFSASSEHFLPKATISNFRSNSRRARDMEPTPMRYRSFDIARIGFNIKGICKSALSLSFALLFGSVRAPSAKRTISNFRSNSWRGICNYLQRTIASTILFGMGSTLQVSVSLRFSFFLHYFSAPPEHFLPKVLSQNFALIPGGSHGTTFDWTMLLRFYSDCNQT
jgi:hypothetical protein